MEIGVKILKLYSIVTMQTTQQEIDFVSKSPINEHVLSKQAKRLYEYLSTGKTIHVFHPAKRELRIGFLNSRIPEIKKAGHTVYKRYIKAFNLDGEQEDVVEYSLNEF